MGNWLLIVSLGFLGSFGHCVGMCGPLTVAFSLSQKQTNTPTLWRQLAFHSMLNLGRIISYTLVGAVIGVSTSVLVAGGQLAGIGSDLRQGLAIFTGILLIWMGLSQINPKILPRLPLPHPMTQGRLHQSLNSAMLSMSNSSHSLMPLLLGMTWGLIPCGFLYAAQIKASETGDIYSGALTMFGFGLGTLPSMLGVGISASRMSADKRSQLFRLGGWVMVLMGILNLLRTGNTMADVNGHIALFCLMLCLIARPISRLWSGLLQYRRLFGISSFILAVAHTLHMLQHMFNWNLEVIYFLLPEQQKAIWAGVAALFLMFPAVCTSFDEMMKRLGKYWRYIHLLTIPALLFTVWHTIILGIHYLGGFVNRENWLACIVLIGLTLLVLLIRMRWFWALFSLERYYAPVLKSLSNSN